MHIDFSRPGKPTENAFVESFNGTLRAESECLNVHWFATIAEAKQLIEEWRREYNESPPHRALGEQTPSELAPPPQSPLRPVCGEIERDPRQKERDRKVDQHTGGTETAATSRLAYAGVRSLLSAT